MAIRISEVPKPAVRDVATKVDAEGNNDGILTPDELAAAKSGGSKWDATEQKALKEIEQFLGVSSNTIGPDASGDLSRLNDTQRKALEKMKENSAPLSTAAHAALVTRITGLGFTEADLEKTLEYIRTRAPVNVNFNPSKGTMGGGQLVDAFLTDTSYRNQFETKISSGSLDPKPGSGRDTWEKDLFLGVYHEGAFDPTERPKYGTMNPARNVTGGSSPQYGDSHFVLKPGVRSRATFTPYDSGAMNASIVGTAEHFEHVLLAYQPDSNITAIMNVALGKAHHLPIQTYPYIEAQIHGPLDFATDVAEVVVDAKYKGTDYEAKVREFCTKNKLPLHWTDGKDATADPGLWS